ncbi:YibE/F family protein [Actinomadura sp. SCN-SB]|uniref:YibE/F family protein n=1 Tax=Actinomadura sp. SCN-SB TaxID=3373092 RepID=UPI0037531227
MAARTLLAVIIPLAVVTLAALAWMWPSAPEATGQTSAPLKKVTGTVVRVDLKPCPKQVAPEGLPADADPSSAPGGLPPTDPRKCGTAQVQLTAGPLRGRAVTTELPSGPGNRVFGVGDDVILVEMPADSTASENAGSPAYQLSDHDRSNPLWLVGAAFALAVIAFGRWRGVTALIGLAVTFALLLFFLIPAILEGRPPLLTAIVCAAAIMLAVLYLTHGFTQTTSIAVIGTLGSLTLTGVLAMVAIDLTSLTGITDDSSLYLDLNYQINTQGLLLASIIIGSLGVLDDVTITQAATVRELARANPSYGFAQLYRAAARVGRAHIASVINTVILAYAGASLPLLLLFSIGRQPLGEVVTSPVIAQEIVRSVAGTLGLIAAVPLTTALAALAATRPDSHPTPDGRYPPYRGHRRRIDIPADSPG